MERAGLIVRLACGLYQLPDVEFDANHTLAEVAKRIPNSVICLGSALSFHDLSDRIPASVWVAVSKNSWTRRPPDLPVRLLRFSDSLPAADVETHCVEGVPVSVISVAKIIADCFRHRDKVGLDIALQGMREALGQRKASPADIARTARQGRVSSVVRPYLEALTASYR